MKLPRVAVAFALCVPLLAAAEPAKDIVIADFEGETYGDWKTTGEAFGTGPARGTLTNQMAVDGYLGKGLVNSFTKGDGSKGTLTSPEFEIERKYLAFLIGGGKDPKKLTLNLIVDGKVIRTATGPNDRDGGSETLMPDSWDVEKFLGKKATIRIVDNATGGWGHINVDHLVLTDRKPPAMVVGAKREFKIEKRYLRIPIENGAAKRKVTILVDGRAEVTNEIELASRKVDWWASIDARRWKGKTVAIEVDKLPSASTVLESIEQRDAADDSAALYREKLRGQFHFSSRRGWLNDPNGLVYFGGEYHLFYQHNPYGWAWGNMHWGHAVSKDLVHWSELGNELAPDAFGPMFSGSAVVDVENTSGLGEAGKPPLVLLYTAAGNPTVQCLASSPDGRTFKKLAANPVLKQVTGGNRDPKVTWHAPTKSWVMVLYVEVKKRHTIHFFTSKNLKDWKLASITEGGLDGDKYLFECPDFFELPVDGDAKKTKWVLTAANSDYAIGTFDGTKFTPEESRLPGHRGRGFYAAQTFSDIPKSDGRRIQIGWFQTETKGEAFNQSMTIPMELKLATTPAGPRLSWTPVKELEALRAKSHDFGKVVLKADGKNPLADAKAELVELRAEFEATETSDVTFTVRGATIAYDPKKKEIAVDGLRVPVALHDGKLDLAVYCDRTGLEIFAGRGHTYIPLPFQPKATDLALAASCKTGPVSFAKLEVHELKSAWK